MVSAIRARRAFSHRRKPIEKMMVSVVVRTETTESVVA